MVLKETAVMRLSTIMLGRGATTELTALVEATKDFVNQVSKSKGGKVFRHVLDAFLALDEEASKKVAVCEACIAWTEVR